MKQNIITKNQLKKQIKLIKESIDSSVNFSEILSANNWTYDDLVYQNYEKPSIENFDYKPLSKFKLKANNIPVVSFFSGAGGLDLGFEAAGFSHIALVEKVELFCNTLRANRPDWKVIGPPLDAGDVSKTDEMTEILRPMLGSAEFEGVFVGGPPCQPFSIASNQRYNKAGGNFKRTGFSHKTNGNLLFDYVELIKRFKPASFLIENVPGLLAVDGGEQLQKAYSELESCGYTLHEPLVLLAAEHNVPQNRTRLFIIGNRKGKNFTPPKMTGRQMSCSSVFELPYASIENHVTRNHSAESIARYMKLPYGARDQLGRVDRLNPLFPSKTVIAGGTAGGGRSHLHPFIPRTISVRECARIQTFPDNYIFTGPVARQFTQVGNAVPPVLAAQLAKSILSSFF
ncbi:MAG: DNA (cytosine-5-)-methyltransferase [Cytophagales bacterium]|nr:DNA (cytosine-5-)-methyltransferase [Cytophagales bacterium]